jgi:pimeloyl-ACP methyl ester carboxylesterase
MAAQTGQDVASRRVDLDVRTERDTSEVGVRYFDAGTGGGDEGKPPVVLLHGIGLDAAAISWKRVVPVLARDRRVLALDFPGHGGSDKPARSYTTPYYAGVLDAFLDSIDVERAALVGISMGGGIALGRALDSPERVSRLVLVDSHGLGRDAPWRAPGFLSLWMPGFAANGELARPGDGFRGPPCDDRRSRPGVPRGRLRDCDRWTDGTGADELAA